MITLIKNSAANLKGHKLRLIVAFIWIIIGITSVVFVSAMGNAMSDLFKSTFKSLAPNTAVIYFEPTEMENLSAGLMQPFAKSDLQAVQSVGGVESAEAYNKAIISAPGTRDDAFYGEAKYFGKSSSISVVEGLSMRYKITKGRAIKYSDEGSRVIVLPDTVAKDLFENESPIGKGIEINKIVYQVVGISDSKKIYDNTEQKFRDRKSVV